MGLTRREALVRVAGAGLGIVSAVRMSGGSLSLSAQLPVVTTPPPPDPRFPPAPSWKTELRELAPNVFAYVQGGGPGQGNQGVSNAGVLVGHDQLMAVDATVLSAAIVTAGSPGSGSAGTSEMSKLATGGRPTPTTV